jgi:hypothetical protein
MDSKGVPQPARNQPDIEHFLGARPASALCIYADTIIINAYEHRTLLNFETFFNITVWFACFPPDEPHTCHLFLNRALAGLRAKTVKGEPVIPVPLRLTKPADERRDFMAALLGAISLK